MLCAENGVIIASCVSTGGRGPLTRNSLGPRESAEGSPGGTGRRTALETREAREAPTAPEGSEARDAL